MAATIAGSTRDSASAFASPSAGAARTSPGSTPRPAPTSGSASSISSPSGNAEEALGKVLRYTHGDRFPKLPGYHTFTSHWHMATAMAALAGKGQRGDRGRRPTSSRMFKDMGVEIVHLAEFHGDGHPQDPGPVRLPEMEAMFAECKRLSDGELLFLPGEEANIALGQARRRQGGRPLALPLSQARLLDHETRARSAVRGRPSAARAGLSRGRWRTTWSSSSSKKGPGLDLARPDQGIELDARLLPAPAFYQSDLWLGAAWKAMPADLSLDKLGTRALDLLDDMANWGQKKYLPGEVDVFKIDHTHELYGHMNINYIRLEPDRRAAVRRELAARARQPARGPILRHHGRSLDPGIHRQRAAERVEHRPEARRAGRGAIPPELDVSAPLRRAHLRRRHARLSRPDRPLRHGPVRRANV